MLIHEYQGKQLFAKAGLPTPRGQVANTPQEARKVAESLGGRVVVKAQVHAGGRGKAGGVKLAANPDEAEARAREIIGMKIKGLTVDKVLVEEAIAIKQEFYLGITLDRGSNSHLVMFSPEGGMDIEEVARTKPDRIFYANLHPHLDMQPCDARQLAYSAGGLAPEVYKQIVGFMQTLGRVYRDNDALLTEINPLALLEDGRVVAADAKVIIDDNAMFRHPDLASMQEIAEADPIERDAHQKGLAYVRLGGDVGIIGNGAGLVMGSLDMVSQVGGKPANFLDIGGGARAEVVKKSVQVVLSDPNVKGIFFNIFGGITRGDEVAKGILLALEDIKTDLPMVIRLAGTREAEGRAILNESGRLEAAETMLDGAKRIVELIGGKK
ncbi:MAG: ADP-forming succinate--CoA ligase subunit beta [Candidatus Xenobia bacterium]